MSISLFAVSAGISALAFSVISFLAPNGKMKNACEKIMTVAVFVSVLTIIPSVIGKTDFSGGRTDFSSGYDSELTEKVESVRNEYFRERVFEIASSGGIEAKDCVIVYENRSLKKIIIFLDEKVISDESERIHISEVRKKTADAFFITEENVVVKTFGKEN